MAALTNADITTSLLDNGIRYNKQTERIVRLTFGDSSKTYPALGVPMPTASTLGLRTLRQARVISDHSVPGTEWRWDYTNNTLRAYRVGHIPYIVVDEAVTLTSNAGTLKYLPAHIIYATGTISATVTPMKLVPHTVTLATTEMGINWTTGAVTTKATDSVTALTVSYIPQQPSGFFSQANMAINEAIVLDTDKVNTASRAATMAYCYQTAATAARKTFGHAVASGVLLLDINDSGNTSIDCHADEDGKAAVVTYLKYSGLNNNAGVNFVDQAEITLTSEVKEWGKTAGDRVATVMIPGISGQGVTEQDAAFSAFYFGGPTVTPANGAASFNIMTQVMTTAQTGDAEKIHDVPFLAIAPLTMTHRAYQELTVNDAPASTVLHLSVIG